MRLKVAAMAVIAALASSPMISARAQDAPGTRVTGTVVYPGGIHAGINNFAFTLTDGRTFVIPMSSLGAVTQALIVHDGAVGHVPVSFLTDFQVITYHTGAQGYNARDVD